MDTGNSPSSYAAKETEEIEASKRLNGISDAAPMTNGLAGKDNMNGISEEPNEEPNASPVEEPNNESAAKSVNQSVEEPNKESSEELTIESTEGQNELKESPDLIETAPVPNGIEDQKGNAHSSESINGSPIDRDNAEPCAENGDTGKDTESLPQEPSKASPGSGDTVELEKLEETENHTLRTNPETVDKTAGSEAGVKFADVGQIKGGDQAAVSITSTSNAEDTVAIHSLNSGATMMNGKEGIHNEDFDQMERMPCGGD